MKLYRDQPGPPSISGADDVTTPLQDAAGAAGLQQQGETSRLFLPPPPRPRPPPYPPH